MASNQRVTPVARPLSMMKKLSPFVYSYEPEPAVAQQSAGSRAPRLILVASWMDARDLHIAKYITYYQALYPTSRILLVKFVFKESVFPSLTREAIEPAYVYLRSLLESGALSASPSKPEILAHVFSNGGSTSIQALYQLFPSRTGRAFPLHAAVYDSCPGLFSAPSTYRVFMINLPGGFFRLIAAPFVIALTISLWIWRNPLRVISGEDLFSKNWRVLNDVDLVKQTNRSYIYGTADSMVDHKHIEMHAEQASSKGFIVRTELFERSPHVSHMRTDGQRYWKIVAETWEKATAGQ